MRPPPRVDTVAELFFDRVAGIEDDAATDPALDLFDEVARLIETDAIDLVIERQQCVLVGLRRPQKQVDLFRRIDRPDEVIGAPKEARILRHGTPAGIRFIRGGAAFARLVDYPEDSEGPCLYEPAGGDAITMVDVDDLGIDRHVQLLPSVSRGIFARAPALAPRLCPDTARRERVLAVTRATPGRGRAVAARRSALRRQSRSLP